jgi:hypothetical protein
MDLILAGRQSPPPEEQHPKQGMEAIASGNFKHEKSHSDKDKRKEQEDFVAGLPSNPERKAFTK